MYKFCKLYEGVFERHTIACIVYLTLSFLLILLLLLMPHGIVNAESSGNSASTEVIQGDSEDTDFDNYFQIWKEEDNSKVYRCTFPSGISSSFFENSGLSGIKLSDMVECTSIDVAPLPNTSMVTGDTTRYHSLEDVQNALDSTYLLTSSLFYTGSSYQYTIFDGGDYIDIWVANCSDDVLWATRDGLIEYWSPENGNNKSYFETFSGSEFQVEVISVFDDGNIDYFLFDNPEIAECYGFRAYDSENPQKLDGPFNYNTAACKNISSRSYVLASNMTYVDFATLQKYKVSGTLSPKNGFNNVGSDDDEEDLGDDSNHLYLDGANWNFNNVPKKFLSNNGNIYFSCIGLDEYQQNHLNNYYLNYDFKIECSVNYNTFLGFHSGGGGGHSFGTSAKHYNFSDSLYSYYKEMGNYYSSFLPSQTNIRIPHKDTFVFYYKNPQDNTNFYRQTLEQFYNSGDKATFFTKNYLYDNCYGLARIDDDGSQYNCSFSNFIYSLDTLYDEWALENVSITCNAQIFDIEGGQGGNCKSSYNLVNGVENRIDTGLSLNPNPYYGSGVDVATGGNATSNSSVINSGNINIENNPSIVINNDNSGGKGGDTNFIIQLVHAITGGGNQDLGSLDPDNNGFFEWMGVNRWLQVLNQAFGYVPSSIFTILGLYFGVVCLILICAFVLKIIVEFL